MNGERASEAWEEHARQREQQGGKPEGGAGLKGSRSCKIVA